jgi:Cellulose biosynthesis GIL
VALMRLGVSMVIPKELSGSGARMVAESMRGSVSARSFETNVDQVFAESQADSRVGFMGIAEFRLAVDRLLGISEEVEIPVALIRFSMASAQALRAASGALQRGARDTVFTEYDNCVWALLFGCGAEHAEVVLSRLLGARFERLMAGWQRFGSAVEITQAMRLLDHAVIGPSDAVFSDTVGRFDSDGDNVVEISLKSA